MGTFFSLPSSGSYSSKLSSILQHSFAFKTDVNAEKAGGGVSVRNVAESRSNPAVFSQYVLLCSLKFLGSLFAIENKRNTAVRIGVLKRF